MDAAVALRVEHELHDRRRGRNMGVLALLIGMVAIVFGLTVVKVLQLGDIGAFERFDHVYRPGMDPEVPDFEPVSGGQIAPGVWVEE